MTKQGFFILLLLLISFSSHATNDISPTTTDDIQSPWLTKSKSHQYLGLSALALGALTAIAPKPDENDYENSLHRKLALSATFLGGAALGTGFVFHYKDLSLHGLFRNPDNLHAFFATIGTLGFLYAVSVAPNDSHIGPGVAGIVGMATAIKITW